MREPHFLAPTFTAAGTAVCGICAGLLFGVGYWEIALALTVVSVYLARQSTRRAQAVRENLVFLREAIASLPDGSLPGMSTAPGVEITRLAAALDEMNTRVRDTQGKLEHDRDRLRAVFTSMRDAVIALGKTGKVALINPVAEHLFDIKAEDVVGKSVLEVIRHHQLARAMHTTMQSGTPATLEFETFEVPPRHFQAEVAPVHTARGELSGAVAVLHNVTELRRLERVRSEFVANVSHELRTPITSIKGFLETLLDGAMNDPDNCRHFLSILSDEADRLANLVNDLLDLSRLEEDHAPLQTEVVELYAESQRSLELVTPIARDKDLSVSMQVAPELFVVANQGMLRQALINLLDNAIKYTPSGGRVWIEGKPSPDGRRALISVCDTGPGIPSQHLERLFERFYRVDKARSRAVGGTGLGLSIVRHIVERHGGKVWAESTLGRGSKFTISLPRYEDIETSQQ
jgi:two-component system phosphate regulon sensor histidine kinase PhoR